jgi:NDP-sugar pyrophosphorylase family protein
VEFFLNEKWSAVILAGGLGTRLNPLTTEICKPMVKVTNKAMVNYAIDHLRFAGIKHIIVCVKHMGETLRDYLLEKWNPVMQEDPEFKLEIPYKDSRGTADAVRKVWDLIDSENFIVSMADIVTNLPIKEFMDYHIEKQAEATVSMKPIDEFASKYGNTVLNPDGRVKLFLEKPSAHEIFISSLTQERELTLPIINTGIYIFRKDIAYQVIMETEFMDFGKEIFPYLLENNYKLYGFNANYYWMDVGAPRTYLWANWDILREHGWPVLPEGSDTNHDKKWVQEIPKLPNGTILKEQICIGKNVQFGENVHINSLTVIGDDVTIGNGTTIDRSVIWDDVVFGQNCNITQSVVANGCKIGNNVIIRSESILGPYVIVEDGVVLDSRTINANEVIKKDE